MGLAAKGEWVAGNVELSLAGVWRPERPWAAAATATGPLLGLDVYGEAVVQGGGDRTYVVEDGGAPLGVSAETRIVEPAFLGTAGFSWTWSDETGVWNLAASGQYFLNGAGYADPDLFSSYQAGVASLVVSGQLSPADLYLRGRNYGAASLALSDIARSDAGLSLFWLGSLDDGSGKATASATYSGFKNLRITVSYAERYGALRERVRIPGVTAHAGSCRRDDRPGLLGGMQPVEARVLVIEDELDLARLVGMYLEREGMTCVLAPTAEEALAVLVRCALRPSDPGHQPAGHGRLRVPAKTREGTTACRSWSYPPGRGDEDIVLGLGLGADEFISKPVAPRVLAARVQALLRRARDGVPARRILRFGEYELDPESCLLSKAGERVGLSGKEVDILVFLATAGGRPYAPKEIYERVWGQAYGDLSIVGVYVQRLRRKLEDDPQNPALYRDRIRKGLPIQRRPYRAERRMGLKARLILLMTGIAILPVLSSALLLFSLQSLYPGLGSFKASPVEFGLRQLETRLAAAIRNGDFSRLEQAPESQSVRIEETETGRIVFDRPGPSEGLSAIDTLTINLTVDGTEYRGVFRVDSAAGAFNPSLVLPLLPIAALGTVLLFTMAVSLGILRSLSRSMGKLEVATREIASGSLDFKLELPPGDSLASLAASMDSMRQRLKEEYARRDRFILAVSHDLKTPLAVLEGYLDALADGFADSPEKRDDYIRVLREKTGLLGLPHLPPCGVGAHDYRGMAPDPDPVRSFRLPGGDPPPPCGRSGCPGKTASGGLPYGERPFRFPESRHGTAGAGKSGRQRGKLFHKGFGHRGSGLERG